MAMGRTVSILFLLVAGVAAEQVCAADGDKVLGITKDKFMQAFSIALHDGAKKTLADVPEFKEDMHAKGQCQWECVGEILTTATFPMMFGAKGMNMDHMQGAITGAFRACYPSEPRDDIVKVADAIAKSMDLDLKKAPQGPMPSEDLVKAGKCAGAPPGAPKESGQKFINYADKHLGPSIDKTIKDEKFAALAQTIKGTFECQYTCLMTAMKVATKNLWKSGTLGQGDGDSMSVNALTGAAKACYPAIPHAQVRGFIAAVLENIDAELDEVTRLYPTVGIPHIKARQAVNANAIPMFTMGAVGSAVFAVGMLSGALVLRRMGTNSHSLQTEDQGLE